ncbi:AraC family transcriptional regulator [Aquincola sp. S2]|uniref:AraC family transcriptional regulator n=1 Tax=Pseudaquabacterium terrae TaxID=2732868 RepID=A0ABX2EQA6_9BURK|nr:AraC family transcriptional regulator [Aquabacterium terrae]NRF70720.1 AraC family transcriptional regulator [Aquabacterium terrae]
MAGASSDRSLPTVDRLSALLERFRVRAHLFFAGPLCGITHFAAEPGRAFLHVLRRGDMVVTHRARSGAPRKIKVSEPTLLFYPRPLDHEFHHAPSDGSDFVCATLDFDGGSKHPLVQALPALVTLRLQEVEGIEQTLALLFGETERVRCGRRLLADRLFEVLLLQMLRWLLDHPAQAGIHEGLLSGLSHPKLARTLTGLHERPGHAWMLETMAAEAGMSRSAFAAEFKAALGTTPGDYLLRWRVSVAQTMLRGGVSVKAVSDHLGYTSPAAFSRAFSQVVGASPRAWLKTV